MPIAAALIACSCGTPRNATIALAESDSSAPQPVFTNYHVTAVARPESLLVRADVDIDFQNISSDTLRAVWIVQPLNNRHDNRAAGQSSHIDSVLIDEAPVSSLLITGNDSLIRIPLPASLNQGERVAVSLKVTARMAESSRSLSDESACVCFSDWLPKVVARPKGPGESGEWLAEPADYDVDITVDSGLLVVAPGDLLNDKQLFGMVPNADSIFIDVLHKPYASDGYTFSRLPSDNGEDTYVWRLRYAQSFDFLVLRNYLLDRARKGRLLIESYYPRAQAEIWQRRVAAKGLKYFKASFSPTSAEQARPLKLVVAGNRSGWFTRDIQLVAAGSKKLKLISPKPGH